MAETAPKALPRRLLAAALVVVLLALLGWRVVAARQAAEAGAPFAPGDPGVVAQPLEPVGAAPGRSGTFAYRPGTWHTLVELRGLPEPGAGRRDLVFARYAGGWVLLGGATPGADGLATVNFRSDPPGWDLFELIVTEGVDTAEANPHGRPLLRWTRPDLARFNREPWPIEQVR